MEEKLQDIKVGSFSLIKYRFGKITGVKFRQGKKLRWDSYEAF